jgi:hypothetical protein
MSDGSAAAGAPVAPGIGAVEAVVGTFTKPSDTFGRLVARPTWWLPFLLSVLVTGVSFMLISPKIDLDRTIRESIEKRLEKSGRTMSPEQIQRQVDASKKMAPLFVAFAIAASLVFFFGISLVLWGGARAMGADARYAQLLAIWGHASLPFVASGILSIPLFLAKEDASLTQDQAQHVLASHLGVLLDDSAPGALKALASSVDVFSIAVLFLLVLGFRRLPGMSRGAATWTPIVLWLLAIAVKVGWKAVMG